MWFNSQSSHTNDLKIGNLSTKLDTHLEGEIDKTGGCLIATRIPNGDIKCV